MALAGGEPGSERSIVRIGRCQGEVGTAMRSSSGGRNPIVGKFAGAGEEGTLLVGERCSKANLPRIWLPTEVCRSGPSLVIEGSVWFVANSSLEEGGRCASGV